MILEANEEFKNDGQEDVVDSQDNEEVDTDDVVDSDVEDFEGEETEDEESVDSEVAEPKESRKQTPQENAQYKKMRLKAEKEAKIKLDAEREEIAAMRLDLEQKQSEKRIFDEHLNPNKIYEYADKEGISEEHAERILKLEAKQMIDAEKVKVAENFNKVQEQKKKLQKDKFFELLDPEVNAVMKQYPDSDYKSVYAYMRLDKADELEKQLASNVEKRTTANIHDRAKRRSIGGSEGNYNDSPSDLSEFSKRLASGLGINPKSVAKRVKTKKKNG
jgi:hypothetical protein